MVELNSGNIEILKLVLTLHYYSSKSTENKAELCRELHKVFRDAETYQKMVMAHDTTRIVQCMLKRAPSGICQEISEVKFTLLSVHLILRILHSIEFGSYEHFSSERL